MGELLDVKKHKDVHDSFDQFKVLLYYPNLTPYMFPLEDAKKKTLDLLFKAAKDTQNYAFKNADDFINKYYVLVYENFNIDDESIASMLSKAKKNAEKVLKNMDKEKKKKKGPKISFAFDLLYDLAFWPLYCLFFLYEIIKTTVWHLKKLSYISFIPLLILSSSWMGKVHNVDKNMFKALFSPDAWKIFMHNYMLGTEFNGGFQHGCAKVAVFLFVMIGYFALPVIATVVFSSTSSMLKKRCDWIGIERTFKSLIEKNKKRFIELWNVSHNLFVSKAIPGAISNVVGLIIIIVLMIFAVKEVKNLNIQFPHNTASETDEVTEVINEQEGEGDSVNSVLLGMTEYNNHFYQVYDVPGITWEEANALSQEKGGHLATITSEEE